MAMEPGESSVEIGVRETTRLEAISDGVFAIVVTLLAIEIHPPTLGEGQTGLLQALLAQWPLYVAFLLSFVTTGVMWMNHHMMFRPIRRSSRGLQLANGLLLLLITLVPFTTLLVADYLQHPEAPIAIMVYTGHFACIALSFNLLWFVVSRNQTPPSTGAVKSVNFAYMLGPLSYLVALVVANISVMVSLGICIALVIFYILSIRD